MSAAMTIAPAELAAITGRTARHELRLAVQGVYGEVDRTISGRNAKAVRIHIENLPADLREKLYARNPHLAPRPAARSPRPAATGSARPPASFEAAAENQKLRANARYAAVLSFERFLSGWGKGTGITRAKQRWVEQYGLDHPEFGHFSVDSIERWTTAYRTFGLDGLVDANNGESRRGKTNVPRAALNFFLARYLDKDAPPTIARAIEDTRLAAIESGWKLPGSDAPFYRYVERHVPEAMKLARRDAVDTPSKFLPYISREMDVPYRTLQSDHHIADVFVNCEGMVCGKDGCRGGHRPWLTPMFDVGSRKVISYQISLDVPNSERILRALKLAVDAEGLPDRFYCDNGKDFKKAAGGGAKEDEYLTNRFRALGIERVFAIPYNAQAKPIERWFRTLVDQRWRGTEGYCGRLGNRSERTAHLCKNPHLLSSYTEFCQVVDAAIVIYNTTAHRGTGMNGRSPSEAFAARIPMRRPHELAFKLVFWQTAARVFDRNGVRINNTIYTPVDPDGSITAKYLRSEVKVLVNPDDVSRALLCNSDEQFLCEAIAHEYATHDTRDAITTAAMDRIGKQRKVLLARLRAIDPAAASRLRLFKHDYVASLTREATRRRADENRMVAAGGNPTTSLIPSYSRIAMDFEAAQNVDPLAKYSAADRELAASVPPLTNDKVEQLLAEFAEPAARPQLIDVSFDHEHVARERLRLARERKAAEGRCWFDSCESRRTIVIPDAEECGPHWLELHQNELEPEMVEHITNAIKEEER